MFSFRLEQLITEYKKKYPNKTQAMIAKELGISPQVLSSYTKGRKPSFGTLMGIANFFDVSIDYLLGYSRFRNPYDKRYKTDLHLSKAESELISNLRDIDINIVEHNFGTYDAIIEILNILLTHDSGIYAISVLSQFFDYGTAHNLQCLFSKSALQIKNLEIGTDSYTDYHKSERARKKASEIFLDEISEALCEVQEDLFHEKICKVIFPGEEIPSMFNNSIQPDTNQNQSKNSIPENNISPNDLTENQK